MLSTNSSISRRNASRRPSSKFGNTHGVRLDVVEAAHLQPLEREVGDERLRRADRRAAAGPARRASSDRVSAPFSASRSSSSSGGSARAGRTTAATPDRDRVMRWTAPGRRPRRRALGAIEELRAGQDRRQRVLNAGLEVRRRPCALRVERQRRREILIGHRPAERAPRHASTGSSSRTGARRPPSRRPADEDALAARRVAQAGRRLNGP